MEKQPKFIIEGDKLIIGKVVYHKELATNLKDLKGGGWYKFKNESNTFIFSGSSFDFGTAKIDDIKKAVKEGKVFSYRRNITDKHFFKYDTGTEIIDLTP